MNPPNWQEAETVARPPSRLGGFVRRVAEGDARRTATRSLLGFGCGIAPRNFKALSNPAAIVRARSVGYGDHLPEWRVVPPLIERLERPRPGRPALGRTKSCENVPARISVTSPGPRPASAGRRSNNGESGGRRAKPLWPAIAKILKVPLRVCREFTPARLDTGHGGPTPCQPTSQPLRAVLRPLSGGTVGGPSTGSHTSAAWGRFRSRPSAR